MRGDGPEPYRSRDPVVTLVESYLGGLCVVGISGTGIAVRRYVAQQ